MNYIILNEQVSQTIQDSYQHFVEKYGYIGNLDSYMDDLFSFDGQYKLFQRCFEGKEYQLIGKNCRLFIEVEKKHKDWFYAKRIVFFESNTEYTCFG